MLRFIIGVAPMVGLLWFVTSDLFPEVLDWFSERFTELILDNFGPD